MTTFPQMGVLGRPRTTLSNHELIRIANWQTTITREEMQEMLDYGTEGAHESLMRSYQILDKVKRMLQAGTPREVVLELIALMESNDCQPYAFYERGKQQDSENAQNSCAVCDTISKIASTNVVP